MSLSCADSMEFPDSLFTCPYHSLLLAGPLDRIQCSWRADECKSLLDGWHWCVNMYKSFKYITYEFLFTCPACLRIQLGWEVSGYTAAILRSAASSVCSEKHVAFLCCSQLAFFPCFIWFTYQAPNVCRSSAEGFFT